MVGIGDNTVPTEIIFEDTEKTLITFEVEVR